MPLKTFLSVVVLVKKEVVLWGRVVVKKVALVIVVLINSKVASEITAFVVKKIVFLVELVEKDEL